MRNNVLPFSPPFIGEEEINEVVDTLRIGLIITDPKVKILKLTLGEQINTGHVVAVSSWTSRIYIALVLIAAYNFCITL